MTDFELRILDEVTQLVEIAEFSKGLLFIFLLVVFTFMICGVCYKLLMRFA